MKFWTIAATATALSLAACSPPAETPAPPAQEVVVEAPSGEYAVDVHHTTVTARVLHFGLSHYQLRLNGVTGTLNFNAEDPSATTVAITVDTRTLDTPYAGDRDFDAELQNSEWLDSTGFPTATFQSTAVEVTGPNTARLTGDLTIRGVTQPATFDVTYNSSWAQHPMGFPVAGIGFSARGVISRAAYGLNVLQPQAGAPNSGVADDVELVIEAEFNRPNPQGDLPAPAQPAEPVN